MWQIVFLILVYIAIAVIVINSRTSITVISDDFKRVDERFRDTEPKDVWIGLFWFVFFIWYVFKAAATLLHEGIALVLFMFCIKYNKTKMYNVINEWLEII